MERKLAFDELFTNIWHQGTEYEASIYAPPFLVELLRNELVPALHAALEAERDEDVRA